MVCILSHTDRKNWDTKGPTHTFQFLASTLLLVLHLPSTIGYSAAATAVSKALKLARMCPSLSCSFFLQSLSRKIKVPSHDSPISLTWLHVWLSLQVLSGSIKEQMHKQKHQHPPKIILMTEILFLWLLLRVPILLYFLKALTGCWSV